MHAPLKISSAGAKGCVNGPLRIDADVEAAKARGGTVSRQEADAIVARARKGGLARAERRELRRQLRENLDAFEPAAQQVMVSAGIALPAPRDTEPKPVPAMAEGPSHYEQPFAQLVRHGIDYRDVKQGDLGDCYFLAALSSLAKTDPTVLRKNMKANADGSVTFTLYRRQPKHFWEVWKHAPLEPVAVRVDREVVRSEGGVDVYASSTDRARPTPELWVTLYEKAYAKFRGSYSNIGNGGLANDALEAITGRNATNHSLHFWNRGSAGSYLEHALRDGAVTARCTSNEDGFVSDHEYSITGFRRDADGTAWVQLRNPWGHSEPGFDGSDDGLFWMKSSDFPKRFSDIRSVNLSRD